MSTPPSSDFLALQTALKGRYSVERELGRGGMGVVYLAHEVALDRPVALKILPGELASRPEARERFLTEARTAARLSHPNIVPIFTVDAVDDLVFFAMAYVRGETLGQRVRRGGPLPTAEVVRVLREVAWALAYAHAQGVVHRDVKPDNILLEEPGGRALVADFGIARGLDAVGAPGTAEVLGTAEFMSPEQVRGGEVDARSDIYALGVLGFYALTGRFPFEGSSAATILAKHLEQPAPPVASVARGAPARLARAIDHCLRKEPADRFPDGEALADALAQGSELERQLPVALRVFINRNREAYRSSGGMALLLALFLPGIVLGLTRAGEAAFAVSVMILIVAMVVAAPLIPLGLYARKLLVAGYGIDELRLAFKQDVERRSEELVFEFGAKGSTLDKRLKRVAYSALGVAGVTSIAMILVPGGAAVSLLLPTWGISSTVGILTGLVSAHRERKREDLVGRRWLKLWNSRVGRWFFKIAGLGLGKRASLAAPTYRPTELVIGLSADRLFEELPRAVRRSLEGLPETVRKLEADAQRMRQRVEELDRLLAEIGEQDGVPAAHGREALRTELESARGAAEARRTELLSALETLRLGLLRMQAGAGSVESMTMELSAARGLSGDIELLLQGEREVERMLRPGGKGTMGELRTT